MASERVVLFDGDGAILQMIEGAAANVVASAAELDLAALPVPAEITADDFSQLDRTHQVVDGVLVALP